MAREHKLILIIGFSLFLVVAVFISDHLSQARTARLAEAGEVAETLPAKPMVLLRRESVEPERMGPSARRQAEPIQRDPRRLDLPIGSAPIDEASMDLEDTPPLQILNGSGGSTDPGLIGRMLSSPAAARAGTPVGAQRQRAEISPTHSDEANTRSDTWRDWIDQRQASSIADQGTARSETPAATAGNTRTSATPAVPLDYVVQENDSLYRIAERFLGDGNRWRELAAYNKGKVSEDGGVRSGVRLLIPPEGVVIPAGTPATKPATTPRRDAESKDTPTRRYTVKKGDSLGKIAQRLLGSAKRTADILRLNRDRIDDADEIYVGMTLVIPAD